MTTRDLVNSPTARIAGYALALGVAWATMAASVNGKASQSEFRLAVARDSAWKASHEVWSQAMLAHLNTRDSIQTAQLTEALLRLRQVICRGQVEACR